MLRLLEQGLKTTQAGTAALVGAVAGLEEHEQRAVQRFIENPNGQNVNLLATYASVESPFVEDWFHAMPDSLVWKEDGTWHVLVAS